MNTREEVYSLVFNDYGFKFGHTHGLTDAEFCTKVDETKADLDNAHTLFDADSFLEALHAKIEGLKIAPRFLIGTFRLRVDHVPADTTNEVLIDNLINMLTEEAFEVDTDKGVTATILDIRLGLDIKQEPSDA